jgi:hypothetical protein
MGGSLEEIGAKITCTEWVISLGLVANVMKAIILKIKSMESAN